MSRLLVRTVISALAVGGLAIPAGAAVASSGDGSPSPSPTPTAAPTPTATPSPTATPRTSAAPVDEGAAPAPTGTLSIDAASVSAGIPVTFTYGVDPVGSKNWIGIFRPADAPVNQEYVGPSVQYSYIPTATGTATFATSTLAPGDYVAYALEDDGYHWLAQPVSFTVTPEVQPLHFPTSTIPLRNASAYAPYAAEIGGLIQGDHTGITFRKLSGPAWVRVGASGAVRGTPLDGSAGRPASAVVEARNAAGESARATIVIDVRRAGAELVPSVRAMTWNMWLGGSRVGDHLEKEIRIVLDADVDVIGAQETSGTAVKELGEALGWDYYQAGDDVGILSRYPIVERTKLDVASGVPVASATIRLDARRKTDVTIWNAHLAYTPYGPYDACFGHLPVDQLLAKEADSGRTQQITDVVQAMQKDLRGADRTPVLLTGDFNAASHLDWSRRTDRCGYTKGVPWPTSTIPTDAGLVDTYRTAHRDPLAVPGVTWSPIYKTFTGGYGYDSFAGQPEPQDRIDFVYAKGDWKVASSETLVTGDPKPESDPAYVDNEWTSDHRAVITEFRVR